jgi:hypothetical protein
MKNSNQSSTQKEPYGQHFECNIEKCWLRMGIVTVTLLTGFTFSMTVASAKTDGTVAGHEFHYSNYRKR